MFSAPGGNAHAAALRVDRGLHEPAKVTAYGQRGSANAR